MVTLPLSLWISYCAEDSLISNQNLCISERKWGVSEYPDLSPMTESTPHCGHKAVRPLQNPPFCQEPSLHDIDQRTAQRELALFERFLETGRRAGEFVHGHDPALVAEIVGDLWVGSLRKWVFTGRKFSLERRLGKKLDLLWSAVAP